jgi:hypothetical protein
MNKQAIITILLALIPQTEVEACLHLRLPRHCDEGEQDGDDGLFVHVLLYV